MAREVIPICIQDSTLKSVGGRKGEREGREGEREGREGRMKSKEGRREGKGREREEWEGSRGGKKGRKGGREEGEGGREGDWQSYISMSDSISPVSSVDVIGCILQLTHPICAHRNNQPSHLSKIPHGGQVNHTLFVISPVPTVGVPCVVRELSLPTPFIIHPISLSNQSDYSTVVICNLNQSSWPCEAT